MLRIHLTDEQRTELQALRQTDLPAVARTRLEMVFLSDTGWSAPRIARHLGNHPHTVRSVLKGFRGRGAAALHPDTPGPDPDHARRATVTGKLSELLGQDRTWTARQLADALGPGIGIGHRQTRRYLALLKAGYRRTARTVGHKQDPKKVERAERVLDSLKKKWRRVGCGCSTWTRAGSARPCRPGTRGAYRGSGSG
jgi:putative transposase